MAATTDRVTSFVRAEAWWAVPSLAVAIGAGLTLGLWGLWLGYAICNAWGVWHYGVHHGPARASRHRWMKRLAIILVPTGLAGLLNAGETTTPSERSSSASPNERIRKSSATSPSSIGHGGMP